MFNVFTQELQSIDRSEGGLGLGLAIVQSLVDLHAGHVSAFSEGKGRGSTFTLAIPAANQEISKKTAGENSLPKKAGPVSLNILVVDDNKDAAQTVGEFLGLLGHAVRFAYDGPSALRMVEEFKPEVALLDIGLPGMDGYELADRLRAFPGLERIRLIAASGYGPKMEEENQPGKRFDAYLVKPVDLSNLVALLDSVSCNQDAIGREVR